MISDNTNLKVSRDAYAVSKTNHDIGYIEGYVESFAESYAKQLDKTKTKENS